MKKIHLLFTALFVCVLFFTGCKKDEFIVTFNPNGARGAIVTQHFTQKIAQPLMANSFIYRGYVFAGWNTVPDGSGISYKDQENVLISTNVVLYAQWQQESDDFTITFHANGGGVGNMEPQVFAKGVSQPLSPNAFYYENHTFNCWCTSPNGNGQKFENQQNITVSSSMMLYAQWTPNTHTYFVYFHPNGGAGSIESQEFTGGESQKLNVNTFTQNGYTFKNWNTDANGEGISYNDEQNIRIFANMVLYAQWKEEGK